MVKQITVTLDGKKIVANEGETIFDIAKNNGNILPHLCHADQPEYRSDGNCRACMVSIKGERVLAASCIRQATDGMEISTCGERETKARNMVLELLLADQPAYHDTYDPNNRFWHWADHANLKESRMDKKTSFYTAPQTDSSHQAMRVNLDACIQCNLCVRACREVQVNDVIGMAHRGANAQIIFDQQDAMGDSTCVACGECVQACPTGALMPSAVLDDKQKFIGDYDKKIDSLCPFCGVGCQTTIYVKDNKPIRVDGRNGPANRQKLCVKGRFGMDYASHPQRLTKPLIRCDDAPKSWDCDIQVNDIHLYFREATWEEAIEKAAQGFLDIKKAHGHTALAGFGSAKGSNEEAYLFQKLIRTGFGTNNVDHCTRLCHASSVAALLEGIGSGAVTAPFTDVLKADCIIVIGARPTENHPVAATYIKQAAKLGKKLIIMDPREQGLSRYAWRDLRFTPGSDVAMLNAIIHVIIKDKLYNQEYIDKFTENFTDIAANIDKFSPENMSEHCGISAEILREIAYMFATSARSIILWGMGVSQHVHGTDNARCLIALAMITGHIGREGTGLHPLRGQNNVQGASDAGLIPMVYPDYQSVEDNKIRAKYEDKWKIALNDKKGLTVVEIINAILDNDIKSMFIMGENPAMSDPDTRHARQALASLQHLVVQEIFLTETAFHADIILPASSFLEKTGSFTNSNRQVQIANQALDLPGEARQDWRILTDLAQAMGLDWNYQHISDVYDEMSSLMPSLNNISWKRLTNENCVTYPCDAPDKPGNAVIFGNGYPTASGKAKLVKTDLIPPAELPDEEYPMILTTGRLLEHWHTGAMTRRAKILDGIAPEAMVHLNPRTIKKYAFEAGQKIRIETRRGVLEMSVYVDRHVSDNMIFIPFCFAEGPANMLTNPALDPYGKIPEFKYCAARLSAIAA